MTAPAGASPHCPVSVRPAASIVNAAAVGAGREHARHRWHGRGQAGGPRIEKLLHPGGRRQQLRPRHRPQHDTPDAARRPAVQRGQIRPSRHQVAGLVEGQQVISLWVGPSHADQQSSQPLSAMHGAR
jgi:hypothetical protein